MKKHGWMTMTTALLCAAALAGCSLPGGVPEAEKPEAVGKGDAAAETAQESGDFDRTGLRAEFFLPEGTRYIGDQEKIFYDNEDAEAGADDYYEQQYFMTVHEDGSAQLLECNRFMNGTSSFYRYNGTVEAADSGFTFSGPDEMRYSIVLEGDKIKTVSYVSDNDRELEAYAGEYKGTSEEYGEMTLVIGDQGSNYLLTDSGRFDGNCLVIDGKLDFMGNNEQTGESVDWFIFIEGDSFTYKNYTASINEGFEGEYRMNGDLGELLFTVREDGTCSVTVPVNGQNVEFFGTINTGLGDDSDDNSARIMYGASLESEAGYSLYLEFMNLGGSDGWNYSGSLNTPLSAG